MKILLNIRLTLLLTGLSLFVSTPAKSAMILTIAESKGNVIASYNGSITTNQMDFSSFNSDPKTNILPNYPQFRAFNGEDLVGDVLMPYFPGFSPSPWQNENNPPPAIGTGDLSASNTSSIPSGNSFGFSGGPAGFTPDQWVVVASDYTSGSEIYGSLTFANTTLAALGINRGTYTAKFRGGDTLTINAIPEPNNYGLILGAAGLATAIFLRRRRRSNAP